MGTFAGEYENKANEKARRTGKAEASTLPNVALDTHSPISIPEQGSPLPMAVIPRLSGFSWQ